MVISDWVLGTTVMSDWSLGIMVVSGWLLGTVVSDWLLGTMVISRGEVTCDTVLSQYVALDGIAIQRFCDNRYIAKQSLIHRDICVTEQKCS